MDKNILPRNSAHTAQVVQSVERVDIIGLLLSKRNDSVIILSCSVGANSTRLCDICEKLLSNENARLLEGYTAGQSPDKYDSDLRFTIFTEEPRSQLIFCDQHNFEDIYTRYKGIHIYRQFVGPLRYDDYGTLILCPHCDGTGIRSCTHGLKEEHNYCIHEKVGSHDD